LRRGVGDCEDFAIAKMDMLAALGVARADMRLIIARDLVRNADHAVLIVQLDGGSVMLDNVTDRLLDGRAPNDYRPIMSFSQNAKWVHGYNVQQHKSSFALQHYQKRLNQRLLR
jgi:predicted transglutaminase-like cysteine proteinase